MGIDIGMFVKIKGKENFLSKKKVLALSYDICEAFGHDWFWIDREGRYDKAGKHALEIVGVYYQDGPSVYANKDTQLIEVSTIHRYYGEGYERGDLPKIYCVAKWLEDRITKGVVYYGGDSSGVLAEKFGHKEREALWKHFVKVGHEPYTSVFEEKDKSRMCDFCQHKMTQYGFGQNYAAWICKGCGLKEKTDDGGVTYQDITAEED